MNQQQKNARLIVAWLCSRFGSENVFYPGLGKDGEIHLSQSSGTGSVISFQVGNEEYAVNFLKSLKLFKNQVSFGSVCSSIEIPWHHSHASVPSAFKSELEFGGDLIRLSVGIEDVQDLIMDLESAAEYCKSPERLGKTVESKGAQKGASRRSFSSSSSPFEKGNSTIAIHGGEHKSSNNFADSLTSPISMSSAFWFKDSQELLEFAKGNHSSFEYGRYGNPTTKALENKLVSLERGSSSLELDCLMSSSGMNSATTMLLSLVPQNGHIITTKDCYRRTRQFISVNYLKFDFSIILGRLFCLKWE
jgi:cystathionine beta-lyase/cystathionine gamma-synthase